MVFRVEQSGGEFRVVLSAEAMAALQLTEGAAVEVRPVAAKGAVAANSAGPTIEYLSVEETLAAFQATLPQHLEAYIELAK